MSDAWSPPLQVSDSAGRCRLSLAGYAHGHGRTLQEAADDLVQSLLALVMDLRAGALVAGSTDVPRADPRAVAFLHDVARVAEQGGDLRERVLGPGAASPPA